MVPTIYKSVLTLGDFLEMIPIGYKKNTYKLNLRRKLGSKVGMPTWITLINPIRTVDRREFFKYIYLESCARVPQSLKLTSEGYGCF